MTAGVAMLAAVACALATLLLVAIAPRVGLVDDARDAPGRKKHARPVPLVGGLALAATLALLVLLHGKHIVGGEVLPGIAFDPDAVLPALGLALATGLCDDLAPRGLPPFAKLLGQMAASLALARGLELEASGAALVWARIVCVIAGVVAQNAANTFDNADGALVAVASAGLVCVSPFVGATLAFLPFNLLRRPGSTTPIAWLGDSGAHLLGILLLTTPVAWAALVLPALDLVRVVIVRWRSREPIWRGDRRHLAHALEARGLGTGAIAGVLALLAAPAIVAAYLFAWAP